MALDHNVDLKADRLDPQISDTRVAAAAGAFKPSINTSVQSNNQLQPPASLLSPVPTRTDAVTSNAGFAQRNVFGEDLISIRWARGAMGVVNNLTKNFFAVLSFQWWRTLISAFGLAFLNLMPFFGVWLTHGWARLPYAVALLSIFLIYLGMSWRSAVPSYYFFLHPISTVLFVYTLLRSMFLTLWNDGIEKPRGAE